MISNIFYKMAGNIFYKMVNNIFYKMVTTFEKMVEKLTFIKW